MKNLKFKTTVNCEGCLKAVAPFLDKVETIHSWKVDFDNPDKMLTVSSSQDVEDAVIGAVKQAGFQIEAVKS